MKSIILSLLIPGSLFAKGLDKLQPDTPEPEPAKTEAGDKGQGASSPGEKAVETKDGKKDEKGEVKEAEAKAPPAAPVTPVEPGFQKAYIGAGLGIMSLSGSSGDWSAGGMGDLEFGYKVMKFQEKYDVYGTFRYRPTDVTVESKQRSYRGVVESYLFGAKAQLPLGPKIFPFATGELGISRGSLKPIDGIPGSGERLAKSGVDLTIGAGVSYLVLDKLAAGARLALGAGTYKTVQFGIDLRYLL